VLITGKIEGNDVRASGIIIGYREDQLYIVTARHSVRRGKATMAKPQVWFRSRPGEYVDAALVEKDYNLDFALLRVDQVQEQHIREGSKPAILCGDRRKLEPGQIVYSLGLNNEWPSRSASPETVSTVIDYEIYFNSKPVKEGYSGGALFNSSGELVGMITQDQGNESCVAISIETIIAFLGQSGYPVNLVYPTPTPNPAPSPQGEGEIVGTWERRLDGKVFRIKFTPDGQWQANSTEFPFKPSYYYGYRFEPERQLLSVFIEDNGPTNVFMEKGRTQWSGADHFTYTVIDSSDEQNIHKVVEFERIP